MTSSSVMKPGDESGEDAQVAKRGILIDPFTRQVREVLIPEGIQGLYDELGCDCFCGGASVPRHFMYVGDDIDWSTPVPFFSFSGQPFPGRAVILGVDRMGESTSCTLSVEDVMSKIKWPPLSEVLRTAS